MSTYRIFPSTNGPSAATSFSGSIVLSVSFCVTAEAYFAGYWIWCCNTGQSTAAVKCCLWQTSNITGGATPSAVVPGSVVTSGTLTAGQWNYIPLATPIALSLGGGTGPSAPVNITGTGTAVYQACIGMVNNFPDTNNWWTTGDPGVNGYINGPLICYSDPTGNLGYPPGSSGIGTQQGLFVTGSSDPTTVRPGSTSGTHDNLWVDVQIADYSSSGLAANAPLRLWPGFPKPNAAPNGDNTLSMSATAFSLSKACKLNKILMFNSATATGFPSRVGIWNTDTQTIVSGTDNSSPSWLDYTGGGAASHGDGWIYVDYSGAGVTLPAGHYAVSFYNGSGLLLYNDDHNYFFSGTNATIGATVAGAGYNGISWANGILTAPNVANGPTLTYDNASGNHPGQSPYLANTYGYPGSFEATADWGETRWADIEVIPLAASGSGLLMTSIV